MAAKSWKDNLVRWIESQRWLDQLADPLQRGVQAVYRSDDPITQQAENTLNGTWLGHPLHPVLVDFPVGVWSLAVLLDSLDAVNGEERFSRASDAAVAAGAVGASMAAVAGLTDWQHLRNEPRRVGMLHALLNTTALGLFLTSLGLRKSGNRTAGRGVALGGFGVLIASAYLGGDLVFRHRIGTNHGEDHAPLNRYRPVLPAEELLDGRLTRVEVEGTALLLLRRGSRIYAINDICTHLGCSLSEGQLREDDSVVCGCHGSRFDLRTGKNLDGPAAYPEPVYDARIRAGQVELRLRARNR